MPLFRSSKILGEAGKQDILQQNLFNVNIFICLMLTFNVPKILDLKSSFEQIFSKKLTLGAPVISPVL